MTPNHTWLTGFTNCRTHTITARNLLREKATEILTRLAKCPRHTDYSLTHYCEVCDELLCPECSNEEKHASHPKSAINDSSGLYRRMAIKVDDWKEMLTKKKQELDNAYREAQVRELSVSKDEQRLTVEIVEFAKQLKNFAEDLLSNAPQLAKQPKEVTNVGDDLRNTMARLDHMSTFINSIVNQKFPIGLFKAKDFISSRVKD